jgi:hypothetical protein
MDSSHALGFSGRGARPARCATDADSGTAPEKGARTLDVESSVAPAVVDEILRSPDQQRADVARTQQFGIPPGAIAIDHQHA